MSGLNPKMPLVGSSLGNAFVSSPENFAGHKTPAGKPQATAVFDFPGNYHPNTTGTGASGEKRSRAAPASSSLGDQFFHQANDPPPPLTTGPRRSPNHLSNKINMFLVTAGDGVQNHPLQARPSPRQPSGIYI